MKIQMFCLSMFVGLTACTAAQELPNPSAAQEQAAWRAYEELRDGQYEDFLAQLEPELQRYFQDNSKVMRQFAQSIPKTEAKSKTIMLKKMETGKAQDQQYKVSYEIAYPKNLVQYDVSFDQAGGSTQIKNFNIRVFGE